VASWIAAEVTRCDREAWEAARIEAGVPVNGREVTPDTIAAELGLVDRTVSFTKGCYTGQELVARLDARGSRVARVLRGIVLDGRGDPPPAGAEVWTRDGAHELGHLTSVAPPQGSRPAVALALVHRRVEPPEAVVVRWGARSAARQMPAEARSLPFGG
jgi:folate-binding protein YgfZ